MTMAVVTVVFSLGAVWLSYATQSTGSAGYERRRQQSIDAANSALVVAAASLGKSKDYTGTPLTDATGRSAQYEVAVTTDATDSTGLTKLVTATGYAPNKTASGKVARAVRQVVKLVPQLGAGTFSYAIQSGQGIKVGSSTTITGDLYAGQAVELGNANTVTGNIHTQNNVLTGANFALSGSVWAMGEVNVSSSSSSVNGSIRARGVIKLSGTVSDNAVSMSTIEGYPGRCSKVGKTCAQNTFVEPVPSQTVPTFTYQASNYPGLVSDSTGEAMVTRLANKSFKGTYYADSNATFTKQQSWTLTGDTTIFVKGNISLPGTVVNQAPGGQTVNLRVISTQGGDITPSNNLTIPATISTLFYGGKVGSSEPTNSIKMDGAIVATDMSLGAKFTLNYKPVTAVAGFTFATQTVTSYNIRNVSTREVPVA